MSFMPLQASGLLQVVMHSVPVHFTLHPELLPQVGPHEAVAPGPHAVGIGVGAQFAPPVPVAPPVAPPLPVVPPVG